MARKNTHHIGETESIIIMITLNLLYTRLAVLLWTFLLISWARGKYNGIERKNSLRYVVVNATDYYNYYNYWKVLVELRYVLFFPTKSIQLYRVVKDWFLPYKYIIILYI